MNILLLTEVYPPEPVVGSFRAQKVALALAHAGHRVWVVTNHAGTGDALPEQEGVTLIKAPPRRSPIQVAAALRSRFRAFRGQVRGRSENTATGQMASLGSDQQSARKRRGLVAELLSVPDEAQGLIPSQLDAVTSLDRTDFDLVYSTSPSHSVQIAALLVARRRRLPWIAEFRDPWTDNPELRLASRSGVAQGINRWLERLVFRRASAIVAVTRDAGDLFRRKLDGGDVNKVLVALNGISRVASSRPPREESAPLRLVYAGSIYPPRTAVPFIESLARVRDAGFTAPLELTFVGDCRMYEGINVEALCRDLGLGDVVRFRDWLPQQAAQELVGNADLLLLPAQRWVHQIPNKAFDYLGSRVPVIALCEPDSELARLLKAVGGHTVVEHLTDLDTALLHSLNRAGGSRETVGDDALLAELTVELQMRRVVGLVERVAGRSGVGM